MLLHKELTLNLILEPRTIDDVTVLYCEGRITYGAEATKFSQTVAELMPRTRRLVIELNGVEMIDSAGLGQLVVVFMWTQASGCSIKLVAAEGQVRDLLELTNLLSVFETHATVDDALLSFRGQIARSKTAGHAA